MGSKAVDISDFETPEKSAAWWKIPQEVRNNVKALKLDNIGINKVDKFAPAAGYGDSAVENGTMSIGLYCDDTEQTLARYPNGESNFIKVISDSDGEVAYEGTRPNRWKNANNEFVKDIKYIAENPPYMNTVKTDIKIGEYVLKDGYYYTKVTLTAKNISAEKLKGSAILQMLPSHRAKISGERLEFDLNPQEEKSREYDVILPPGKFVFAAQSADAFVDCAWEFASLDMVLGEDTENAAEYEFINCRGESAGKIAFSLKDDLLTVESELLKTKKITLYAANPIETAPGQVMFSCEETDFAKAPAVINGAHGLELAPQLRCPAEITYVFENEPKTKVTKLELTPSLSGEMIVSLDTLGIENINTFWLDAEIETDIEKRYPMCLFASQMPKEICHMFAEVKRK